MVAGPLDERVRDRIVAETRGNPLALLELPHGRSPAELAGGFGLADEPALSGRIEESFRERLAALPPSTRLLLLIAAAEPVGDPLLVWRAAAALGIGGDAAAPATAAGLVDLGAQVRFRHPLVRSAVYRAAAPEERQRVHRALADATDAEADPDRRAWHRAQATAGLDEDVAAELEHSAGRARARGGLAAGAAFHERAAELTPDPARRAQRALAAAQGKHQAGARDAALRLLAMAQAGPLDELEQRAGAAAARADHVRHDARPRRSSAAARRRPSGWSRSTRRSRARPTSTRSPRRSPPTAWCSGGDARDVAAAVLAADWDPPRRACDLLLDGLALPHAEGYAAGAAGVEGALRAFRDEPLSEEDELRWLWLACHVARAPRRRRGVGRAHCPPGRARPPGRRVLAAARRARRPLQRRALLRPARGGHVAGRGGGRRDRGHRQPPQPARRHRAGHLAGRDAEALALTEARRQDVLRRGEGLWLTANDWGSAVLYNGLGRYDDALAAAERGRARTRTGLGISMWVAAELIEAAVRSGKPERAAGPLARLGRDRRGQRHGLGARVRRRARAALLAEGAAAERALPRGDRAAGPHPHPRGARARAHLLYGEWLRRENRRVDAREQLRAAHEMLTEHGQRGRSPSAPAASCWPPGRRCASARVETLDDLTPQETQIARLAAGGYTNPEIGAQLFLSPRTVEWHLRKVFGKLGISSRRELRSALPGARATFVAV